MLKPHNPLNEIKARVFSFLFFGIMIYFAYTKLPSLYHNFSLQNNPAPVASLMSLSGESIEFPQTGKKVVLIFWATWCGPCKVEMNRLNKMMAQGLIRPEQLIAVNIGEDQKTVADFLSKENYQLKVAMDVSNLVADSYKVSGTPTVVFIDENAQVNWVTTGVSPTLEQRVKSFLN
jgi:cytochrome c biogenesis protein CcmG/thiol:disulfide interchange protein DsbE